MPVVGTGRFRITGIAMYTTEVTNKKYKKMNQITVVPVGASVTVHNTLQTTHITKNTVHNTL